MLTLDPAQVRLTRTGFVSRLGHAGDDHTHSHDTEHEFHFFNHGEGRFLNGRDWVTVPSPSLVFTPAGVDHSMGQVGTLGRFSFFYICFEMAPQCRDTVESLYGSFRRVGHLRTGIDFIPLVERLVHNQQSPDPLLRMAAQYEFLSMLYEVMGRVGSEKAVDADVYARRLIKRMRGMINGTFDLGEAADDLGISKAHLVRVFRRSTGLPPVRYFNRLKMDTARELLKRTDLPLAGIAAELSFCDEFYFSRVFKRYTGMSPAHFRRTQCRRSAQ